MAPTNYDIKQYIITGWMIYKRLP